MEIPGILTGVTADRNAHHEQACKFSEIEKKKSSLMARKLAAWKIETGELLCVTPKIKNNGDMCTRGQLRVFTILSGTLWDGLG